MPVSLNEKDWDMQDAMHECLMTVNELNWVYNAQPRSISFNQCTCGSHKHTIQHRMKVFHQSILAAG